MCELHVLYLDVNRARNINIYITAITTTSIMPIYYDFSSEIILLKSIRITLSSRSIMIDDRHPSVVFLACYLKGFDGQSVNYIRYR